MKQKLAVFDIDGTLHSGRLGVELLRELSALGAIRGVNTERFNTQYQEFAQATDKTAYYNAHLDDYYTSRLTGVHKKVFETAANNVAAQASPHFYKETVRELEKRRQEKYFIILISKSPEQSVAAVARTLRADAYWGWPFNFDADQNYVDQYTDTRGDTDKAYIIKQLAEAHNLAFDASYAYGDSTDDISMLRLVSHPVAVNPEPLLLAEAQKEGWRIMTVTNDNRLLNFR